MKRPSVIVAILLMVVIAVAVAIMSLRPPVDLSVPGVPPVQTAQSPAAPERKITATLFYVAEDGVSLVPLTADVAFGEPVSIQARHIIEAQIARPPAPHVTAIPQGTTLRAVYVSERGEAFVDLSAEVSSNHTGGALDELLSVYAIVNALTVNLPAIKGVQILVEGKEVDTLAGHVDLRQPLAKNLAWMADKE